MPDQVTTGTDVNAIQVTSGGVPYILLESNDGSVNLEMWKNSGSGWAKAGSTQYATDVHGKGGATIGYQGMGIDSSNVLHVVSVPTAIGYGIEIAYNTFNTSTDSWGTWTEIGAFTGNPYTYNRGVSVVCDSSGYVWVGWGESDKKGVERVYVTTDVTGSWATTDIGTGSGTERNLYIQVDSSDNIHAFWYEFTGTTYNYRKYTSGSGWGTTDQNDSSSANFYDSNVVEFGSSVFGVGAVSGSIYEKDMTSAPVDTGLDHDTAYDYCYQTVYDGDRYLLFSVVSGSYNQLVVYVWNSTGSTWDLRDTITDNTANVTTLVCAYDTNNQNYVGVESAYQRSGYIYYHQTFGTPTDSAQAAWTFGGGTPSDNQSAFLAGRDRYSERPAYMRAVYDDGSNIREATHAFTHARWPQDKQKAYIYGKAPIYVDVVNFTSPTSTGTQTITGSLNGNQPVGAIFMCTSLATDDSEDDGLINLIVGATDGTNNVLGLHYKKYGGVGGGIGNSDCCWVWDGTNISRAVFDSWTTDGIVIDWTAASAPAYDMSVMLFAADDPELIDFYCKAGYIPSLDADETADFTDPGFQPDFVWMLQFDADEVVSGMAVANGDTIDNNVLALYTDLPNDWDMAGSNSHSIGAMTGYYWNNKCYVSSWLSNGFTLYATEYAWFDMAYICIRMDGWVIDTVKFDLYDGISSPPENKTISGLRCFPEAVAAHFIGMDVTSRTTTVVRPTVGFSMWNDDTMYSMAGRTSNDPNPDVYVGVGDTGSVLLSYDINGSKQTEAIPYSFSGSNMVLTVNNSADIGVLAVVMGPELDLRRGIQSAYMFGAAHTQPAQLWGWSHTTSSQSVFFNVVDAQDSIHCWLTGLNPERGSQSAYMLANDDPTIIAVPFTASGSTQQITDLRLGSLTPKAALFVLTYGTSTSSALMSVGFTDGTNSYCSSRVDRNDTTSPYLGGWSQSDGSVNAKVMIIPNGYTYASAGNQGYATFSQFITGGVEINWSGSYSGRTGVVYLFAGTNLDADVDIIMGRNGTGSVSYSSLSYEPDTILFLDHTVWDDDQGQNGGPSFGIAVNDGENSVGRIVMSNSNYGFGDCYPCPDWGLDVYFELSEYLDFTSFDTNGFTVYQASGVDFSTYGKPFLALKHNGRKSHFMYDNVPGLENGEKTFVRNPADYNIIPETAMIISDFLTYRYDSISDYYYFSGVSTYGFLWLGAGTNKTLIGSAENDIWDCISQYEDRVCKSEVVTDYQIRGIWRYYQADPKAWTNSIQANILGFITNGYIMDVVYNEGDDLYSVDNIGTVALMFGTFEVRSNQSAYMKGQKVDWPSRTPRGCYLEGTATTETSSTPAFLRSWERSNQYAFCEGYQANTSSKAAHVRGSLDTSSSQYAHMVGSIDVYDNQYAYIEGTGDQISTKKSFLRGEDFRDSQREAYLSGYLFSSGSTPAYLRNGWDTSDNQAAYLEGVPSRDSQTAYLEGGFDGEAWWSIPAFLAGGGIWPFSDDFTGTDDDGWNDTKWVTDIPT